MVEKQSMQEEEKEDMYWLHKDHKRNQREGNKRENINYQPIGIVLFVSSYSMYFTTLFLILVSWAIDGQL